MTSKVSVEEANSFMSVASGGGNSRSIITVMEEGRAVLTFRVSERNLRPGGYISGPTQMGLADSVAYFAIFTRVGIVPMAVTSSLNYSFLRPCIGEVVEAEGRLLKLGRSLAVVEVDVRTGGSDKPCGHAVVTYALPQQADT